MSGVVVGRKRCRLTAAIYVRRSSADSENTEADAFSRSLAAFLPLSGQQVATILGVVAVLTGERG